MDSLKQIAATARIQRPDLANEIDKLLTVCEQGGESFLVRNRFKHALERFAIERGADDKEKLQKLAASLSNVTEKIQYPKLSGKIILVSVVIGVLVIGFIFSLMSSSISFENLIYASTGVILGITPFLARKKPSSQNFTFSLIIGIGGLYHGLQIVTVSPNFSFIIYTVGMLLFLIGSLLNFRKSA